ncbi:MAG: hypothetical protein WCS37_01740 [Chloroflexota bacterium]|nr:hypothetical protein [Chloroflexota bacterium]
MRNNDILEQIKRFSPTERLALMEAILQLVREDFQRLEQPQAPRTNGKWPSTSGISRTSASDSYADEEEMSPSSSAFDEDDFTTLKKLL